MATAGDDLAQKLRRAEAQIQEMQFYVEDGEKQLAAAQARVAELEAVSKPVSSPSTAGGGDAALVQKLALAEAKASELKAYLDDDERELETLRAKVAELESGAPAPASSPPKAGGGDAALVQKLALAEAKASELKAYLDDDERELETLRAKVAQLEAAPPASSPSKAGGGDAALAQKLALAEAKAAELKAYLDDDERELETLRAKVAQFESAPPVSSPSKAGGGDAALAQRLAQAEAKAAELKAYLDDDELELETLRARVAEYEAPGDAATVAPVASTPSSASGLSESGLKATMRMQGMLGALQTENKALRQKAQAADQRSQLYGAHSIDDLQAQLESEKRRANSLADKVQELDSLLSTDLGKEAAYLRERVSELESTAHATRELNARLAEQVERSAGKDVARLEAELDEARKNGNAERVRELEASLEMSIEALATLQAERARALEQVRAYVERDETEAHEAIESLQRHQAEALAQKEAEIEQLRGGAERAREATEKALLQMQVAQGNQEDLLAEYEVMRKRALNAEEKYGRAGTEVETVRAELTARVGELEGELENASAALKSAMRREKDLGEEFESMRLRALTAEGREGHAGGKADELKAQVKKAEDERDALQKSAEDAAARLKEAQLAKEALEKMVHGLKTSLMEQGEELLAAKEAAARVPPPPPRAPDQPPPPPMEVIVDSIEGFTAERMQQLERLLERERVAVKDYQRSLSLAEKALAKLQDELEASLGRMKDLQKRLGMGDDEAGAAVASLEVARKELKALRAELGAAVGEAAEGAVEEVDAEEAVTPEAVLTQSVSGLEQAQEAQAAVTKEATQALEAEQRAKETLLSDLTWLKAELEKLTNVREDLKQRLASVLTRETKRRGVLGALLAKLRATEVTAAARIGSLRRLQAAIEKAQRNAVRVQTIYFQKQIGSLQRQVENMQGLRRR